FRNRLPESGGSSLFSVTSDDFLRGPFGGSVADRDMHAGDPLRVRAARSPAGPSPWSFCTEASQMKHSIRQRGFWGLSLFSARGRPPPAGGYRPALEALEDRTTPAAVPFFTPAPISTTADGATSVAVADVDGDGDLDVLSASNKDDKIAWYENDGAAVPRFTLHTISITANGAASVAAVDLDGDGDTDVLSASFLDDKVAWYENDGA